MKSSWMSSRRHVTALTFLPGPDQDGVTQPGQVQSIAGEEARTERRSQCKLAWPPNKHGRDKGTDGFDGPCHSVSLGA